MRHFLTLLDYGADEILHMVELGREFKRRRERGERESDILRGRSCVLIFEKPSTRTRASLVVAIEELGGRAFSFSREEMQLSRGEPLSDTARVLSKYFDCIIARVYRHRDLEVLAEYSSIPVLNALSDRFHPMQAVADVQTMLEKKGKLEGLKIAFIGDGRDNVLNSLMVASAKLGLDLSVACPPEYRPEEEFLRLVLEIARESGSSIEVLEDPRDAVAGADVVYTDVFVSMGQEREREERLKKFLPTYRVTKELLELAKKDYIFMHCLPARRGEEVEEGVLEDERHSVVFDQAENRLHSAKGILAYVVAGV